MGTNCVLEEYEMRASSGSMNRTRLTRRLRYRWLPHVFQWGQPKDPSDSNGTYLPWKRRCPEYRGILVFQVCQWQISRFVPKSWSVPQIERLRWRRDTNVDPCPTPRRQLCYWRQYDDEYHILPPDQPNTDVSLAEKHEYGSSLISGPWRESRGESQRPKSNPAEVSGLAHEKCEKQLQGICCP